MDGFGWIERGTDMCGIGSRATVPEIGNKTGRGRAVSRAAGGDTYRAPTLFCLASTLAVLSASLAP